MTEYYPLRRVPQNVPRSALWRQLTPLVWPLTRSSLWSLVASAMPRKLTIRGLLDEKADRVGAEAVEKAQRIYFNSPGLDTLTVRSLSRIGKTVMRGTQNTMIRRISLGLDHDGEMRKQLPLLPRTGYDSLMIGMLAVGTALGYFRGGPVKSLIWWDSADEDPRKRRELPDGHPYPLARRFGVPQSLGDLAADIDDLYWAEAYGLPIKITRVGQGADRRWLVSLPGTYHMDPESQPNPADIESNIREELNIPSAARVGLVAAVRSAMYADGVESEDMVNERVLIVGHSQGGIIAAALAAAEPKDVGFTVDAAITLGAPARRLKVRDDVNMLALEHDQDVIPSMDGTPRREADQRVVVKRKLNIPKRNPLFYAHSSSTYTETLLGAEVRNSVAKWGRASEVLEALQQYLPKPGEQTRVTQHYAWQELVEPQKRSTFDAYVDIRPTDDWKPVSFGDEIEVPEPLVSQPIDLVASTTSLLGLNRASHEQDEEARDE